MNVVVKNTIGGTVTTENYRLKYDNANRVAEIYYTTNDPLHFNQLSTFRYANDTIYDTIKLFNNAVIEIDTFVTDNRGYITTTYIQGVKTDYSYYVNLLTRVDYSPYDYSILTSYNGNITQVIPSSLQVATEKYSYYTDMENRIGDYLQLGSVLRYGTNLYNNRCLVDSLWQLYTDTKVDYTIDADKKIIHTKARITDTSRAVIMKDFDLQYETF